MGNIHAGCGICLRIWDGSRALSMSYRPISPHYLFENLTLIHDEKCLHVLARQF